MKRQSRAPPSAVEHREELVPTRVDLAAAGAMQSAPDDGADVGQERGVPIAQPLEQACRPFDVGEEKRHVPGRQGAYLTGAGLDLPAQPLVLDGQS